MPHDIHTEGRPTAVLCNFPSLAHYQRKVRRLNATSPPRLMDGACADVEETCKRPAPAFPGRGQQRPAPRPQGARAKEMQVWGRSPPRERRHPSPTPPENSSIPHHGRKGRTGGITSLSTVLSGHCAPPLSPIMELIARFGRNGSGQRPWNSLRAVLEQPWSSFGTTLEQFPSDAEQTATATNPERP